MPSRNARRAAHKPHDPTAWMPYVAIGAFTIAVFVAAMTLVVYGMR